MHDDDEGHYEDQFLSRRREFMPWEVKGADRVGQDAIREVLRRHLNAEISPDSYISPDALIFSKTADAVRKKPEPHSQFQPRSAE